MIANSYQGGCCGTDRQLTTVPVVSVCMSRMHASSVSRFDLNWAAVVWPPRFCRAWGQPSPRYPRGALSQLSRVPHNMVAEGSGPLSLTQPNATPLLAVAPISSSALFPIPKWRARAGRGESYDRWWRAVQQLLNALDVTVQQLGMGDDRPSGFEEVQSLQHTLGVQDQTQLGLNLQQTQSSVVP